MKNFKLLIVLLLASFSYTSCILDDDAQTFTEGPNVLLFPTAEVTGFFLNDDAADYDYTVPLNITGGNGFPLNQDVTATFEIDPSSTATQGVEYDFLDSSGSVVIESGNTFTNIPLVVHSGALDPANPATVVLNVTGSSSGNVVASGNRGQITINLQATCTSDLGGTYMLTVVSSTGNNNFHPAETVTEISEGEYLTTTTGTWDVGVLNGGVREGFTFKEVCGSIVVEQQNLAGVYSNLVDGTEIQGTVDALTGDITLEYTIGFSGNTVFNTYTATYVKL